MLNVSEVEHNLTGLLDGFITASRYLYQTFQFIISPGILV